MPKYKVVYFNERGRAEIIRMILSVAGQEYEDVRIELKDWPQHKSKFPFEQIPILEVDGEVLTQSLAVARYLAREYGLCGSNSKETYLIDEAAELMKDLQEPIFKVYFPAPGDSRTQEERDAALRNTLLPIHLRNLEKVISRNNGGKGFLVGDKLSYADLFLEFVLTYLPDDVLAAYPLIRGLRDRVVALPEVAAYLKRRPETLT